MKPARLLDDPIYGDYPALYALGIVTQVKTVARRRPWMPALAGVLGAVIAAAAAYYFLLR